MLAPQNNSSAAGQVIGFREFVALMAALMAINAFGVDIMLPALPEIGHALAVDQENQRQWVISCYMIGFGSSQIFYGPLADRFGRKPVMTFGLALYVIMSLVASFATSFTMLIVARTLQGMAAASTRILVVSIVRDCYAGRQMARVMSLAFMVFLTIPILAPSLGKLITLVAPWRTIFHVLAFAATAVAIWMNIRLRETLHAQYRRNIDLRHIASAAKRIFTERTSLGYALASTVMLGPMMGFVNSSQQLFADTLHAPDVFPLIFALIAGGMGIGAFTNSRIVVRLGTRRVSHGALLGVILISGMHSLWVINMGDTVLSFALFQVPMMVCWGMTGANFNSMAMEKMGEIAGTAASIQGTVSTLGAATLGIIIGQSFDGTALPVVGGFFLCGLATLFFVLVTERGKLFQPHYAAAP